MQSVRAAICRVTLAIKRWAKSAARVAITILVYSQTGATLLADTSTVFSFGANVWGQTGLGTETGITLIATPIDTTNLAGKNIVDVEAGYRHSLLLADDGSIFAFGDNGGGQTGLGTEIGVTLVATPIDITNLAGKTITQMSAGFLHSLLLADDGSVFAFGDNGHGQTGLGTDIGNATVATPIDTTNLAGKTIKQVTASNGHSLILADDGTVFSFGNNEHGQLGLGTDGVGTPIATPIVTTNLAGKTIAEVAVGGNYSLLLADDGTVFSFGLNTLGQTGLGTSDGWTTVATPIVTTNLAGKTIAHVAADGNRSLLLAEDGTVFSFGNGSTAGLGGGPDVLIAMPIDTTNLAGKTITRVEAGGALALLLADDGSVFSFGANFANGTGIGTSGNTFIATPIDTTNLADLRVTGISAGDTHGLLLAVPASGPGDFNRDGTVDAADYVLWRRTGGSQDDYETWRAHFGQSASVTPGDFNGDGSVDAADYVVWRRNDGTQHGYDTWRTNFGETGGSGAAGDSPSQAAVPEPASVLLFALGLVVSWARTRGKPRGRRGAV